MKKQNSPAEHSHAQENKRRALQKKRDSYNKVFGRGVFQRQVKVRRGLVTYRESHSSMVGYCACEYGCYCYQHGNLNLFDKAS